MEKDEIVQCRSCKFFERDFTTNYDHIGDCRRYPPQNDKMVKADSWCGEFVVKLQQ